MGGIAPFPGVRIGLRDLDRDDSVGFIASWFGLPKAFSLVIGAGMVIATMGVAIVRGIGRSDQ